MLSLRNLGSLDDGLISQLKASETLGEDYMKRIDALRIMITTLSGPSRVWRWRDRIRTPRE
jgi:hypothetical protein